LSENLIKSSLQEFVSQGIRPQTLPTISCRNKFPDLL